jgi:integrase
VTCVEDGLAKVEIEDEGIAITRYVVYDPDRHGNPRYYFRKRGLKKARLRAPHGTRAFLEEFRLAYNGDHPAQKKATQAPAAAVAGTVDILPPVRKDPSKGTLAWLFNEYEQRAQKFKDLGDTTKSRRRTVIDEICAEPTSDTDPAPVGLRPLRLWRPSTVEVICYRCPTPATINARLKAFREAFKFAVKEDWLTANPAREVAYKAEESDGYHTWTVDEVAQYEARWPIGSIPRLCLGMLMFTGSRRSDAVVIGKQHRKTVPVLVDDGFGNKTLQNVTGWQFTQFKGRKKKRVETWIPILAPLQDLIDATPSTGLTILETSFHKPYSAKGFTMSFKRYCKAAGLPHCSAHGLRKAAATIAAERGATPYQLMAIFGWKSLSQALLYTKKAEQKRLAAAAMHMLAPPESVSPLKGVAG